MGEDEGGRGADENVQNYGGEGTSWKKKVRTITHRVEGAAKNLGPIDTTSAGDDSLLGVWQHSGYALCSVRWLKG